MQPWAGRRRAGVLSAIAVLAVLAATLWPYRPFPANGAHWIEATRGIRFEKDGLVLSDDVLQPPANDADSYTLELLLKPASVESSHTILAFYERGCPTQFLVRQWTDGLLVTHDANVERDRTQTIKFDVDHAFSVEKTVLVTISAGADGTTVYLDGVPAGRFARFKIARHEMAGQIVLGTSPVTYHPWQGELSGLAIYSTELTASKVQQHYKQWTEATDTPDLDHALARYTFAQSPSQSIPSQVSSGPTLRIPPAFSIPHKPWLHSAIDQFRPDWRYASDVLVNIVGFMPLGLILCAYLEWTGSRPQAILLSTLACGTLSVLIEILQYYVPRRGSDMTDIITNTLGAFLGAMLIRRISRTRFFVE